MFLRRAVVLGVCLAGGSLRAQSDPSWWSGVIRSGDSHAVSENYAPVNLGQVKNLADKARLHLNTRLAGFGGAGGQIEGMVASWPSNAADAYQPANLGQLKAIADKFYARLDEVGFNYKTQINGNLYAGPWSGGTQHPRPWDEASPVSSNYSIANLGQAKILFAWDLTGFTVFDADHDYLPDAWESAHGLSSSNPDDVNGDADGDGLTNLQEYQQGSDPQDFWNGAPPVLVKVSGDNQGDLAGHPLANPLTVKLTNQIGHPKSGTAITFSILSGGGTLSPNNGGVTNTEGIANAAFTLPSASPGLVLSIKATFGGASVIFTATIGDPSLPPKPSIGGGVSLSSDGTQAALTWSDNANNETAYYIERTEDNAIWTRVATLPANSTTFTNTGLIPGRCYTYRVITHN